MFSSDKESRIKSEVSKSFDARALLRSSKIRFKAPSNCTPPFSLLLSSSFNKPRTSKKKSLISLERSFKSSLLHRNEI